MWFILSLEGHKLWKPAAGKPDNLAMEKHPWQLYVHLLYWMTAEKRRQVRKSEGMEEISNTTSLPPF